MSDCYLPNDIYSPYPNSEDYEDHLDHPLIMMNYGLDPTLTLNENGMPVLKDTGNELVNLFGTIGGYRGRLEKDIIKLFQASFVKYPEPSLKLLFHIRDIRGGMGERRTFRILLEWLGSNYPKLIRPFLHLIPEYGRWDDLFCFLDDVYDDSDLQKDTAFLILTAILDGNALAAKWCPRENKSMGNIAKKLRNLWKISPKEYRLLLAGKTQVVENLMCDQDWMMIVYKSVPSQAMLKYRKAFLKHDPVGFADYLEKVKKGEAKINSGTLYPHQIIENAFKIQNKKDQTLPALWNALPNYLGDTPISILPVSDVSGSMAGLPRMVSIALGMYIAERAKGPYRNLVYMFANDPTPILLKGDFWNRILQLRDGHWGGSTNLEATFDHILKIAVKNRIPQDLLPKYIVILSDMQFNVCEGRKNSTSLEMIDAQYQQAGYERPKIIFWNLRASIGHPVEFDKHGTAMVSGFSPSIMESILKADLEGINEAFNPLNIALKTLYSKRYEVIKL